MPSYLDNGKLKFPIKFFKNYDYLFKLFANIILLVYSNFFNAFKIKE